MTGSGCGWQAAGLLPPLASKGLGKAPSQGPQARPPGMPPTRDAPGPHVAAFSAGGLSLESSKEGLCFQGRRQGKGHLPPLMSE